MQRKATATDGNVTECNQNQLLFGRYLEDGPVRHASVRTCMHCCAHRKQCKNNENTTVGVAVGGAH